MCRYYDASRRVLNITSCSLRADRTTQDDGRRLIPRLSPLSVLSSHTHHSILNALSAYHYNPYTIEFSAVSFNHGKTPIPVRHRRLSCHTSTCGILRSTNLSVIYVMPVALSHLVFFEGCPGIFPEKRRSSRFPVILFFQEKAYKMR
jgi:hypothetical protein